MDMFDKMLVNYSEGSGSALEESNKSADNLTGRLNALHNSWTEIVNTVASADNLKTGVNLLNGLADTAQKVLDTFGLLPIVASTAYMAISSKSGGLIRLIFLNQQLSFPSYRRI